MKISAAFWLKCVNALPNVWTGSLHIAAFAIGCLAEIVPDGGKPFFEYGRKLSEASLKRGEDRQRDIAEIERKENEADEVIAKSKHEAAKGKAETAAKIAPDQIAKRKYDKETEVTEHGVKRKKEVIDTKAAADMQVIDRKTSGKKKVIQEDLKQGIEREDAKTNFELDKGKIKHKTKMILETKEFYEDTVKLNKELTDTADLTTEAAKSHTIAMQQASKSILALNRATEEVYEAQARLTEALGEYDTKVAAGDIAQKHDIEVKDAIISAMKAEGALDTLIDTSQIRNKSELKNAYKQDLASKNQELDHVLAKCSAETLKKLTSLITTEIEKQQESINRLTTPKDIERANAHLEKLKGLLNQTDHITPSEPAQTRGHGLV